MRGNDRGRRDPEAAPPRDEEDVDWLETQLELIRQLGEPHYLTQQITKE